MKPNGRSQLEHSEASEASYSIHRLTRARARALDARNRSSLRMPRNAMFSRVFGSAEPRQLAGFDRQDERKEPADAICRRGRR